MSKVISILEENRLFDDRPEEIYVNKIADFFNNYKINPTSFNPFPKNIKRNNDGYIMLNELPYIISDLNTGTRRNSFWMILDNGSRIFVKEADDDEMENELLFQELCKILNIPCANYDIAIINGFKRLVSNSFLALDEYLVDYYGLSNKTYIDIDKILIKADELNHGLHFKQTLTIDGLVKNVDRFPKNYREIYNGHRHRICPLFDNGLRDKARITMPFIGNSASFYTILEYLMQDKEYKNWVEQYILNKKIPNIKEKIQNKKKIFIDNKTYDEFEMNLHQGKTLIKEAYKNS